MRKRHSKACHIGVHRDKLLNCRFSRDYIKKNDSAWFSCVQKQRTEKSPPNSQSTLGIISKIWIVGNHKSILTRSSGNHKSIFGVLLGIINRFWCHWIIRNALIIPKSHEKSPTNSQLTVGIISKIWIVGNHKSILTCSSGNHKSFLTRSSGNHKSILMFLEGYIDFDVIGSSENALNIPKSHSN